MTQFVLVHGAWHGGWCWKKVASLLRRNGHQVHTPTLTGLGDRYHLTSPEIGLETHVLDIVNYLKFEDLSGITMVGHSYGGAVITAAADRAPEYIDHLIYVDAPVLNDGQSMWDFFEPKVKDWYRELLRQSEVDWLIPVPKDLHALGITSAKDVEWMVKRLVPHPLRSFVDPVNVKPRERQQRNSFVYCDRPGSSYTALAKTLSHEPSWKYVEIAAGHDVMVTEPNELTRLLIQLSKY